MPMDHLLNQSASWMARSGQDGHGNPAYGPVEKFRCRIEPRDYELRLGQDRQVKIDARIFFRPEVAISSNDRITVAGVNYRVVKIEKFNQVTAKPDHYEALLSEEK